MPNTTNNQDLEREILQLKQENEYLRKENNRGKLLLKSSFESANGMLVLSIDSARNYLYFNEAHRLAMKNVYGIDVAVGMNVLDSITVDADRAKAKFNYDKGLGGLYHSTMEEYGDEQKFYYESFFNPIKDENDDTVGLTVMAMNVTDRVKAENALIESEAKHQAMLANVGDVIGIMGADGILKYKSSNVEKIFGWKPEEMVGKNAFMNMHPDDYAGFATEIDRFLKEEGASGVYEYRYKHKNGNYCWVELNAVNSISNKAINGVLFNYHDITDRKEANRELKENERLYKALFENLSNSSSLYEVILDEKGEPCDYRFMAVNPIFELSVGRTADSVLGKTLLEEFPETESKWLTLFKQVCTTGQAGVVESYTKVLDMYFEIIAYIPQPGQMAMIGSDITERKKTEITLLENQETLKRQNEEYLTINEELNERNSEYALLNNEYKIQNQKLTKAIEKAEESDQLKNEFLSNMSHEVRTPMNGIIGFSQLLNLPDLEDDTRTTYIETIQQSSNQLLGIIDNIIEISKLGTKQVKVVAKPVNINRLLSELQAVFSIHAESKNIDLLLNNAWADAESTVLLDEIKLYKVMSNLLENAMKFTEKGYIEFGYSLIDAIKIKFYVKDTGIGILKDEQAIIFEKFTQVHKDLPPQFSGLGLGLSIAKENTELMGGEISLESIRNEGSVFYVSVPYKKS